MKRILIKILAVINFMSFCFFTFIFLSILFQNLYEDLVIWGLPAIIVATTSIIGGTLALKRKKLRWTIPGLALTLAFIVAFLILLSHALRNF